MSIIEEGHEQQVSMAYLALVASHSVNGVAALHSQLLQQHQFRDFYEMWPEKFNNKTNGITQRRWLLKCNPLLADLLTGSFVIESIFQIPGIGTALVNGSLNRDYTLVVGLVVLYAALLVVLNLVVDFLYVLLDRRVQYE